MVHYSITESTVLDLSPHRRITFVNSGDNSSSIEIELSNNVWLEYQAIPSNQLITLYAPIAKVRVVPGTDNTVSIRGVNY